MADRSRIEELRQRLQKDPTSIAFAQLAEEYRRARRYREAIQTCQAGLARHPGYLSARVTLGRALIEIGDLDGAHRELTAVLRLAPENLSAVRGLAEVHRKRGEVPEALGRFKAAFELAGTDPAVEDAVRSFRHEAAPPPTPTPVFSQGWAPFEKAQNSQADRTVAYLSRWLEAMVAARRARLYGARA
jgi:tetratricopeptide (TPR) repeat protein